MTSCLVHRPGVAVTSTPWCSAAPPIINSQLVGRANAETSSTPLGSGAKIQSSTNPLGERICFCFLCASRDLKHLIGNLVEEKLLFVLVESYFTHGIGPPVP